MTTLFDKIKNGDYKPTMAFPAGVKKPIFLDKKVSEIPVDRLAEINAVVKEYHNALAQRDEALTAYYAGMAAAHDRFTVDAIEWAGLTGHPKAEKAFAMAYEDGHSGGMEEVANHLIRYADLLLND